MQRVGMHAHGAAANSMPSSRIQCASVHQCMIQRTSKRRRVCLKPRATSGAEGGDGSAEPVIDVTWASKEPLPEPDPSLDPEVREALLRVHAAMQTAETTLEQIEELPSARLPTAWDRAAAVLPRLALAAAAAAAAAAIYAAGGAVRALSSLLAAVAVGWVGWRKGSLSRSGAAAAAAVGWGTLGSTYRGGLTLLAFFFASSLLTRLGDEEKAVDEEHKAGGQRDWKQVACNGLVPTCLALAALWLRGGQDLLLPASTRLAVALGGGFLGYYACCCGDTWASELGQLSPQEPRLITSLRPVRRGTNGGVTLLGLGASVAGGLFTGAVFFAGGLVVSRSSAAALAQWPLVLLGLAAGLVGSIIDSLLGATVQFTGYNRLTGKVTSRPGPDVSPISGSPLLDNNGVNAVSASLTAALAATAAVQLFC